MCYIDIEMIVPFNYLPDIHCRKRHQIFQTFFREGVPSNPSCNNVAPVTNLFLRRATTRSHHYLDVDTIFGDLGVNVCSKKYHI
jgi:hypothetical protein